MELLRGEGHQIQETLPYAELEIKGVFEDVGHLPPFYGATLRGAFG